MDLRLRGDGLVTGGGWLVPSGATGAAVDILVSTASLTAEAVDLHLDEPTIPMSQRGRLLVNTTQVLPGAPLIGTLIRGDSWELISLAPLETEPHHEEGEELFDMPGVGVYGPPYRLRNTAGGGVVLRRAPRSDAPHAIQPHGLGDRHRRAGLHARHRQPDLGTGQPRPAVADARRGLVRGRA